MKSAYFSILVFFMLVVAGSLNAQNKQIKNGDRFYDQMIYPSAVREYERGLVKGLDLRAMERIAKHQKSWTVVRWSRQNERGSTHQQIPLCPNVENQW